MPKKGTPLKRDPTPTRIMTRPSRLRTPRASANPPASNNPLPTVDEESDSPASSPTRATAKPKPKTPVKPKTPAKSKTPAKPKRPAAPKATPKKGTRSSKTPTAAAPAVVDLSGDDGAEEADSGPPEKGIVIASAHSSPLSSPVSVPPSPAARVKTLKTGKRRQQPFDDKPYKDVDVSDEETVPSPTAKAVAGPKRKSIQFADRTYKPGEEHSDEENGLQPKGSSHKRKLLHYDDKASEADDEEQQEDTDTEEDSDYRAFLQDLARSTEAAGRYESPVRAPAPQTSVSIEPQVQESLLPTIDSASSVISESDTDTTIGPPLRSISISSVRGSKQHSPKRQRTNPPAADDPPNRETADLITDGDQVNDSHDPIKAAKELFSKAQQAPGPLDLGEISALFMVLQEQISAFCKTHFDFDLTPDQEEGWPMHRLTTKYKALFEVTQWIADGSGCGWRNFFTKKENRRHLVHGIVSEFFQQHIFKHTAFGIREDMVEDLEDIDRKYIRYDAFVRNKKKAAYLENSRSIDEYFPTPGSHPQHPEYPPTHQYHRDVDLAARRLATMIMQVLEPLLPPPCFDPLVRRSRQPASQRNKGALMRNGIWFELFDLISKAATLHHCIRFAGATGLFVRIAPHVAKGAMFTVDDADRNICVNAAELNSSGSRPEGPDARLRVKMTCFGRVEAVMPRGLDLEQMETEQNAAQAAGYILTREDAERKLFPKLPYELQETDAGRNAVAHLNPVPGTEWNTDLYQANLEDHVDQRFRRDTTPTLTTEAEAAASHPFVTIYPRVAPSNLYCEWVSQAQTPSESSSQHRGGQTLWEAVQEARKEHFKLCLLEDTWNFISNPLLLRWVLGCTAAAGLGLVGVPAVRRLLEAPRSQEALTNVQASGSHALSALSAMGVSGSSYFSALVSSSSATSHLLTLLTSSSPTTTTRTSTTLWATRIDPRERTYVPMFHTTLDTITSTVTANPPRKPITTDESILDTLLETQDPLATASSGLSTTVTTTPMDDVDEDSTMDSGPPQEAHGTLTSAMAEDTTTTTVPMDVDSNEQPKVDSGSLPETTDDPLASATASIEDVTTMTMAMTSTPTATATPMDVDESTPTPHPSPETQMTPDSSASQESHQATGTLTESAARTRTTKPYVWRSTVDPGSEEFAKIQEMVRKRMRKEGRLAE